MVDDSQSEYIALAEMEEVVVADKYYSEPEVLEFIFKIPTPQLSDGVKQDIKNSCVKRGYSVPTLESLAPTNMTVSGIISHLVSAGLPCVYSSSGMAFDREEIRVFFLEHDIALPWQLFPNSQLNSRRKMFQLLAQRKVKASLLEKARARQQDRDEQEERELRRLQLEEARARVNDVSTVAPIIEGQDTHVVAGKASQSNDFEARKKVYCAYLGRNHENKKWNAVAAYFHAAVEGGECSNEKISEITNHKGKIADLINRGENIAHKEGLPLLIMPPKREKQKGPRAPRH